MGDLKFLQSFASWHPSVALATGAAFLAPVQVTACSERRSSTLR